MTLILKLVFLVLKSSTKIKCFVRNTHVFILLNTLISYHINLQEPVVFPYLKEYPSSPSLNNNPDTDSIQDKISQISPISDELSSDLFHTQSSTKDIAYDSTPKYQNFSHSPSLNDNLDNTFDSTDSDFEMLPNPIFLFKLIQKLFSPNLSSFC